MSKKNKNKNNNNGNNQNPQSIEKNIVVVSETEIKTNEEGIKLLEAARNEAERIKKEAEGIKKAANELKEQIDREKETYKKSLDDEYRKKIERREKQMDDEIDKKSERKFQERIGEIEKKEKESEKKIKEEKEDWEKKKANFEKEYEEISIKKEQLYNDALDLQTQKNQYRNDVYNEMMKKIADLDNEKIYNENIELKNKCKRIEEELLVYKEDNNNYIEQLMQNGIKKSEIETKQSKIEELTKTNEALLEELKVKNEKIRENEISNATFGNNPSELLKKCTELEKLNKTLNEKILNLPSVEEINNIKNQNEKLRNIEEKYNEISDEKQKLEKDNFDLKQDQLQIENLKRQIKVLSCVNNELKNEIDNNISLYENKTSLYFANLSKIDKDVDRIQKHPSIPNIKLKMICEDFRAYLNCREQNPLYYDEMTIRTFIAGFASSRLTILEGLSGTGKSSLPRAFAEFIGQKNNIFEIPVQSSWKDRNDLLGFYNDFKKQYKETEFLKAIYSATSDPNNIYIIVLDEMNLSRIEYYFADILSVLENNDKDKWKIDLISDYANLSNDKNMWPACINEGKLLIGSNTWFIGTANKDDSTFLITDKVYDRSTVISFDKKGEKADLKQAKSINLNFSDFNKQIVDASKFADGEEEDFNKIIKELDKQLKKFDITFGNRILNQLKTFVPVYVECGGTIEEAIDVMFACKVMRKLENRYDDNIKSNLEDFQLFLETEYNDDFKKTKEVIDKLKVKL